MTCDATLGVCALCYGMDLSTGSLVEQGMAVGIIAAQSIGEPGTQLTMRTFHIGGTAAHAVEESEIRAKKPGVVKFTRLKVVRNDAGQQVVLTRNGEILILDPKGRELEKYEVPAGANLQVNENQEVQPAPSSASGTRTPSPSSPKSAARSATRTSSKAKRCGRKKTPAATSANSSWSTRATSTRKSSSKTTAAKSSTSTTCRKRPTSKWPKGSTVSAGTLLAKTPREVSGTQDITGGLPRVTEIFEARKPKDPAVMAEIDGTVELLGEKRRGKRTIIVRSESGIEREHLVSHGKHLRVHAGSFVRAGEALVDGPLVPHDILRISGEEAVQQYLTREIQNVYRSQRVQINDKHIEIIVAQMLRKVRVETDRRHHAAARLGHGQVRFPRRQPGVGPLPEDRPQGRQRLRGGGDRARRHPRAGQRPDRGPRRRPGPRHQAEARLRQHAVVGHHQGRRAKLQLHLRRQLPGNHQGVDRGRPGRQDRQPRRA